MEYLLLKRTRLGIWCFLTAFLASLNFGAEAQTLSFRHFTAEDGLPSSALYDIAFDKDGFLWIAGEGGICKFDGLRFIKSPIEKMTKGEVIKMEIDQNSRLWMLSLSGRFAYYGDHKLTFVDDLENSNKYDYVKTHTDDAGNIWFTDINHMYVLRYRDGVYDKSIKKLQSFKERSYKVIASLDDHSVLVMTNEGVYRFKDFESTYRKFDKPLSGRGPTFGRSEGNKVVFCVQNRLFSYDSQKHRISPFLEAYNQYFDAGILSFLKEQNGSYWIATKNGLIYLEKRDGGFHLNRFLEGVVMGQIRKDSEGNYWFSTEQAGLYFLPSKDVKVILETKDKQVAVSRINEAKQLVIGYLDNNLEVLDEEYNLVLQGKLFEIYHRVYELLLDDAGNCYFFSGGGIVRYDHRFSKKLLNPVYAYKAANFGPDGKIWVSTATFGGYLDNEKAIPSVVHRSYAVLPVDNDKAWFGTVEGLSFYDGQQAAFVENELLLQDIRDIQQDVGGNLWVATQGNGLVCYHPPSDSVLNHFTTEDGLLSNNCKQILLDEDRVWLVTSKGLNRLDLHSGAIFSMDTDDGLPSFETNSIFKNDGRIYVSTNRGAAFFEDTLNLHREPPLLHITGVKIKERDTSIHEIYWLEHDQNNIKIDFVGISYRHSGDVRYRYKMDKIDDDWVETGLTTAQYPSMPPGKFEFRVMSKTINSDWSAIRKIDFHILAPFWKTGWFILLVITVSILCLAGGVWAVIRDIKLRNEKNKKLRTSQLTALRAQMNPHFVFNALNSIQDFILRNDSRAANRYLTIFARLIRNVLHFSDKGKISLKKELESIELYLDLEGLRLGEGFEYGIEVDPSLNPKTIFIPPMLIQPFVENAIKHGLLHKNGEKKLYLRVYKRAKQLIFEIEDNGIGRKRSMEIRSQNPRLYPSKAISLTRERLEILSSNSKHNFNVEIDDLVGPDGKATGTKVLVVVD